MGTDWLRPVRLPDGTQLVRDPDEPAERVLTPKETHAVSSLYPQFLDAGIPAVEDHDDD